MKIQSIINGSVTLVLEPENDLEIELLKALTKQTNTVVEVRTPIAILGRTIRGSVLVGGKEALSGASEAGSETPGG